MTVSRLGFGDLKNAATSYAQARSATRRAAASATTRRTRSATRARRVTERASRRSTPRAAPRSGAIGAKDSGAGDADKPFEELYDRLKRELMIEQEQLGQLFHEP